LREIRSARMIAGVAPAQGAAAGAQESSAAGWVT